MGAALTCDEAASAAPRRCAQPFRPPPRTVAVSSRTVCTHQGQRAHPHGASPAEISSEYAAASKLRAVVQRVMDRELTVPIQLPHLCDSTSPTCRGWWRRDPRMPRLTQQLAVSVIDEESDFATQQLGVPAALDGID
jgi:hypothetical protein